MPVKRRLKSIGKCILCIGLAITAAALAGLTTYIWTLDAWLRPLVVLRIHDHALIIAAASLQSILITTFMIGGSISA